MSVTEKTRRSVCDRENLMTSNGHDYHHCFFKSEWFFEVDEEWNGHPPTRHEHDCIHHPGNEKQALFGHKLDIFLKKQALERFKETYSGIKGFNNHVSSLERIIKRKSKHYGI